MLVIIEDKTGQQLWQLDASGKIQRKTRIAPSAVGFATHAIIA
jgi:hypothetical protein